MNFNLQISDQSFWIFWALWTFYKFTFLHDASDTCNQRQNAWRSIVCVASVFREHRIMLGLLHERLRDTYAILCTDIVSCNTTGSPISVVAAVDVGQSWRDWQRHKCSLSTSMTAWPARTSRVQKKPLDKVLLPYTQQDSETQHVTQFAVVATAVHLSGTFHIICRFRSRHPVG